MKKKEQTHRRMHTPNRHTHTYTSKQTFRSIFINGYCIKWARICIFLLVHLLLNMFVIFSTLIIVVFFWRRKKKNPHLYRVWYIYSFDRLSQSKICVFFAHWTHTYIHGILSLIEMEIQIHTHTLMH